MFRPLLWAIFRSQKYFCDLKIAIGCFISVNINLVTVPIDIRNFVMSGGIFFLNVSFED